MMRAARIAGKCKPEERGRLARACRCQRHNPRLQNRIERLLPDSANQPFRHLPRHRDRIRLALVNNRVLAKIQCATAMGEPAHQRAVAANHLHAIDAEVLPLLLGAARDHEWPRDQRRNISRPAGLDRQTREVDIAAGQHADRPRPPGRGRLGRRAARRVHGSPWRWRLTPSARVLNAMAQDFQHSFSAFTLAQSASPVTVYVTVKTGDGSQVETSLKPDAFQIRSDTTVVPIESFSVGGVPASIVMLFDLTRSADRGPGSDRMTLAAFDAAVREIAAVSARLIGALHTSAPPKSRDEETAKARARSAYRFPA